MADKPAITADYVRARLSYNPETGVFLWKERPRDHFRSLHEFVRWNNRYAGKMAGSADTKGHIQITLDNQRYGAHRLAWVLITGQWPALEIDHANGQKADNRWSNLREATPSQNRANRPAPRTSKSGIKGVRFNAKNGKWEATICINKRLGTFDTPDEAIAAYDRAAAEIHGEFAWLNSRQRRSDAA